MKIWVLLFTFSVTLIDGMIIFFFQSEEKCNVHLSYIIIISEILFWDSVFNILIFLSL